MAMKDRTGKPLHPTLEALISQLGEVLAKQICNVTCSEMGIPEPFPNAEDGFQVTQGLVAELNALLPDTN